MIRLNLQGYNRNVNLLNIGNKAHKSWVFRSSILPASSKQENMLGCFYINFWELQTSTSNGKSSLSDTSSLTSVSVVFCEGAGGAGERR